MCCGQQQSPIDLSKRIQAIVPPGYLSLHWGRTVSGFLKPNEHCVEVNLQEMEDQYLLLDGKKFYVQALHFHRPNEHKLNNQTFDAELHIVHRNREDLSYAVVGIFLSINSPLEDEAIQAGVINAFSTARETPAAMQLPPLRFWLPTPANRIIRYEGSLTSNPYTEDVSWIIFPAPKHVSKKLMEAIFAQHPPHSARAIQKLYRRYILEMAINLNANE